MHHILVLPLHVSWSTVPIDGRAPLHHQSFNPQKIESYHPKTKLRKPSEHHFRRTVIVFGGLRFTTKILCQIATLNPLFLLIDEIRENKSAGMLKTQLHSPQTFILYRFNG